MRDTQDPSPGQRPEPDAPAAHFWLRWRVASLVLVALLALPAGRQAYNWYERSREAQGQRAARDAAAAEAAKLHADHKAAQDAARVELDRATTNEAALTKGFHDAIAHARKVLEDKDFAVRLTGPAHVQPGAPNSWKVETLNRHGAPITPKKLELVVKDSAGKTLLTEPNERPTGAATTLTLPLQFWADVKPGTELFLHVSALTDDDRKGILEERIPLARPVYVTHLATDKPLYKPGETIRFRSLTLDRASLQPPAHDQHLRFRLRDPGDAVVPLDEGNGRLLHNMQPVMGLDKRPLRGIGVGEYALPTEAAGGEYKLDLYEVESGTGREILLETRKFIVNRYVPDTFEKKLEFDGKSYGAGDTVQARIEVSRTAGGPMKDAKANVVATVDGREFYKQTGATFTIVPAERGATKAVLDVRFKLPADIFEKAAKDVPPSATLSLNIQDGSDAEPIVRPIPLVTKSLKVEFFPEGGDIIDGVPGRVYFMVKTPGGPRDLSPVKPGFTAAPSNKPADLKGYITDGTNKLGDVATLTDAENPGVNRGHGIFPLKPEPGKQYFLKITSPAGITEPTPSGFPIPAAKPDGVAITALDAVTEKAAAIRVRLQVGQGTKTLHVGAYARGRLVAHQKLDVTAGTPIDVALKGDDSAGGVTRVTVFEEPKAAAGEGRAALVPRAERLIFRKPDQQLILNANPDKARYTPAGRVRLELSAFNEKEQPAPAVLMVGVVNRSVITMADNKTDRLMPTHFLLSGEVKHPAELEHADFLLTDHPKAGVALDLLLGTQGWRRFAEQNPERINPADRPDVDKMLVAHGQRTSAPFALYKLEEQRVSAEFQPKLEAAVLARSAAQEAWNARGADADAANRVRAAQTAVTEAETRYTSAAAELHRYETRPLYPPTWWIAALSIALMSLCVGGVALSASQRSGARRPYYLGTFLVLALTGLAVVGVAQTQSTPEAELAWAKLDDRKPMPAGAVAEHRGNENDEARAERFAQAGRAGAGAMPMADGGPADFAPAPKAAMPPAMPAMGGAGFPQPKHEAKPDARAEQDGKGDHAKKFDDALKFANAAKGGRPADRVRQKEQLGRGLAAAKPDPGRLARPARPVAPGPFDPGAGVAAAEPLPPGAVPGPGFGLRAPSAAVPFVVREYAHQRDSSLGEVRADFTETVYWHPVLVLPESGKTSVEFQLSDDIARYQVLVAGHTLDGRIGAVTKTIEARQPFSVDPKLPLEVSHTDIIDAPVRVTNDSDDPRKVSFALTTIGLKPEGALPEFLELGANGKGRKFVRLRADKLSGEAAVGVTGSSGPDKDSILRAITVVPDGFPGVGSVSDTIERRAGGTVRLPKDVVAGSLRVRLEVYPTSMADLVKGLDGLLREPYGCFEQTSTSNYPNAMILDYMTQTNQTDPAAAKRARELLDRGYAKLVSFECPDTPTRARQGFEWFGAADNQHEALTAYGLLQFKDMARVHPVDPELIKRTQAYLMSRRDGQGGFKRNPRALDQFGGAPNHTTNAYIVWALVESDPEDAEKLDLTKEIQALKAEAANENSVGGKDAYFVALTANVLLLRGDRQTAHQLLDRLKDKHLKAGAVTGAVTSITRSGGRTLEIETTALTLLGWLRANDPKYGTAVKDATKWISQQRGGYGAYGSTQSTILALKALTLFARKSAHPAESGEIKVLVGGKEIAARKFSEKDVEVIGLDVPNAEAVFKVGEATEVEIVTDAKQAYPFALSYTYTSLTPVSAEKCAVQISTKLGRTEAGEGDAVPLHVTFENKLDKGHGMTVAVIGIPAGMKVPTDMKQLTDLREKGHIAYFETRGRELVLYWRSLAPKQKIELTVDLVCEVPGTYRGPASRGYLYYDADHKHWVEPLAVTIAPAADERAAAK
ncbi:MAG: alpha-2-macroglobulin [Planctomycetes bacterium]|nr:alpha-2-macroglobulin [Planctomycetota bacterium]